MKRIPYGRRCSRHLPDPLVAQQRELSRSDAQQERLQRDPPRRLSKLAMLAPRSKPPLDGSNWHTKQQRKARISLAEVPR